MSARLGTFALIPLAAIAAMFAGGCEKKADMTTDAAPVATAAVETGTTFVRVKPAVGDKREEDAVMGMDLAMEIDPGTGKTIKQDMKMSETTKTTKELLALNGDVPSKVKVTYTSVDSKMTEMGKEKAKPSPIAGKTYIIEAKDGKTVITSGDGKTPPAVETKEIEKNFKSLGKPDPIAAALPTTPLKPGEKVDSLAKALVAFMNDKETSDDSPKVSDAVVTFKEKSGDDAVFDISLKMDKNDPAMTMSMPLTGQMKISTKTSEPSHIELKGPITMKSGDDPKSKAKVNGSGTMSLKMDQKKL